jgi:hypothetical protein
LKGKYHLNVYIDHSIINRLIEKYGESKTLSELTREVLIGLLETEEEEKTLLELEREEKKVVDEILKIQRVLSRIRFEKKEIKRKMEEKKTKDNAENIEKAAQLINEYREMDVRQYGNY